ncbi:MAG: general secretion pathway protein GspK [Candidatus Rokubacteria bacterium]|nr:general secretion pathway protein GspK [Candidatus Rokubacteria bacterium]
MSRDERGFALIVVLLVLAVVGVVGAEFAYSMRLEAAAVRAYKDGIIGTHLAEAAVAQATREIVADAPYVTADERGLLTFYTRERQELPRPAREKVEFGGGLYSYRLSDEEARINLNTSAPDRIDRLLRELGFDKSVRDTIGDSLQDWRDPNDLHRLNGAESDDYYLKLPVPYRAKNANLDSARELLQIRGVTPEIYNGAPDRPGLAGAVTVKTAGQININTATPLVLAALGLSAAEISEIEQARHAQPYAAVPAKFGGRGLAAQTRTFRIEADGIVDGRVAARITAIVQRRDGSPPSVVVLEWSALR